MELFRKNACAIIAKANDFRRSDCMKTGVHNAYGTLNAFIEKNKHGFLLLYFLIYLPWFGHLEKTVTTHFHVIHVALDDMIPFCEYFIIPYFLWFGYVAWSMGYFYLKNKDAYFRLCAMLFTGMTIFLIVSTIYPNGHYLRPATFAGQFLWRSGKVAIFRRHGDEPVPEHPCVQLHRREHCGMAVREFQEKAPGTLRFRAPYDKHRLIHDVRLPVRAGKYERKLHQI